jgi:hypothetical protein
LPYQLAKPRHRQIKDRLNRHINKASTVPRKSKVVDHPVGLQTIGKPIAKTLATVATSKGDPMDIRETPIGTMFRFHHDIYVTTSTHYYSPRYGIHMIKAHNMTTGETTELGEIPMLSAKPIEPQETK